MQHIIEALARDMAEHLRPMVAEMVRQELANADGENAMAGIAQNIDLSKLVEHLSGSEIAGELDVSGLAGGLTSDQLIEIAGEVDLMELATNLDLDKLTRHVDVGQLVRDWLADQTFSVRPY
jgi:hypothetical protein